MREQKTDVVYQCTVVSSWATFVTSSIILVIAVVVLFSVERDLWLPALFPEFFFLLILIGNYFSGYGILTITSDRVILSRFHRVITEFRLDEITAAGYFVRLKNRDEQLFIAAEQPPKVMTRIGMRSTRSDIMKSGKWGTRKTPDTSELKQHGNA